MIDISAGGIEVAVLGAVGGVVTYFLNQFVVEWYRAMLRTKRLRDALLVDCVEILHRVNRLPFRFHRTPGATDHDDLHQVMKHPNGFVMCGPLSDTRELVTLLDQRGSRLVVRFFERWETFAILENRYTGIYQKLLEIAAECIDSGDRQAVRELKEEYWDQLREGLAAMQDVGKDLCFFACQLFRYLGNFREPMLARYSGQRWTSWSDFDAELRRYANGDVDPLQRVGSVSPVDPQAALHSDRRQRPRPSSRAA